MKISKQNEKSFEYQAKMSIGIDEIMITSLYS